MKRISLTNTAFEGNNNVYLFDDGPETVLVDTGDGSARTRDQLAAELATDDLTFADIDRILLTHWHHDHVGLAEAIQAESGARIHVHEADAPLVRGERDAWEAMWETMNHQFEAWEMPTEDQGTLKEFLQSPDRFDHSPTVDTFLDGETFTADVDTELTAIHVPGHAAGLTMFAFEGERGREVLSSDALLPRYTPNVGGADVRVDDPLQKYLQGLERIAESAYTRAWPGHREPIDDPAGRAREIIDHHRERSWRVLDVLERKGQSTVWEVSRELFGSLEGIHVLHGPGEAYAHLDHLERNGAVRRRERTYRIADAAADELRTLESQRWPLEY